MRSKIVFLIVLVALCAGCSVTRNYLPEERRQVKRDYLQRMATLAREGYLWEWATKSDGTWCDSLYLDNRVTGYVMPGVLSTDELLSKGDYQIGKKKFFRLDRYPDRAYRIRPIEEKMLASDGTILATKPQPFISRNASIGPLRVLRLPPGTQVFVKAITVERKPDPDGYYLYWSAWEDLTLEMTIPGEDRKVTVSAIPSEFLRLVE
jgi:hypothetical protein